MSQRNFVEVEGELDIWLPKEKEEFIEGEVVEISDGQYGRQITLKNEAGDTNTTPSHKVLQSRLSEIKMGDWIRVVYKGEELPKLKGHNPTKIYKVLIDRPQEESI